MIIVTVVLGVCFCIVALPFVVRGGFALWKSLFPAPPIWVDGSAQATCEVDTTAGGITVIRLPLEMASAGSAVPQIYSVELVHGANAVLATGRDAGFVATDDELVVTVSGLIPSARYSVDGISVGAVVGDSRRGQTFEVGMKSDGITCRIGTVQQMKDEQ